MGTGSGTPDLPQWPAGASDVPDADPPQGRPLDGWLVAGGGAYPLVGFGVLLGGGGWMGPAAFGPEVVLLPALVSVGLVVGVKLQGERLRWSSVVAFAAWVAVVAFGQLWVWAEAIASV